MDTILFHGRASDEVLRDDSFEHFGSAGVIPDAFRVNDGNGATEADAEAVGFRPENGGGVEVERGEAGFEEIPGDEAGVAVAALGLGLIGAEEDVAGSIGEAGGAGGALEFFVGGDHF